MDLGSREWGQQPVLNGAMANSYAFSFETGGEGLSVTSPAMGESQTASSCDVAWIGPEQDVFRVLVEAFRKVAKVKSICAQFGKEEVVIWTLLDSYDRTAREQVYHKEMEVCEALRLYDFDFRVTSAELVPPAELVRGGSVEIYKRT